MNASALKDTLHDELHTLAEHARDLLAATAKATDDHVIAARERLESALGGTRGKLGELKHRAADGARAADRVVRENPYPTVALALGVGALIGFLLHRRD